MQASPTQRSHAGAAQATAMKPTVTPRSRLPIAHREAPSTQTPSKQRRAHRTAQIATILACAIALIMAAVPADATYPGRVGRLAYGVRVAGNVDIYSIRPDGTDPRRLTDDPGFDACAAYNARGDRIAFCSDRLNPGVAYEIWTMNPDGTDQRQLTDLGGRATFPDFSPNGRRLALQWRALDATRFDIWTVKADGTKPRQLTDTPDLHEHWPAWSPNGRKIAFVRSDAAGIANQLWLMTRHGRHQRQLTYDATFKDQLPDWRPDGKQIAYMADNDIWVINPDGSRQINITNTPNIREYGTAWSPDGRRIAYLNIDDSRVYTMNADGTDVRPATTGLGPEFVPAWQPRWHNRH
jgi:Tol biopolymer transport system component